MNIIYVCVCMRICDMNFWGLVIEEHLGIFLLLLFCRFCCCCFVCYLLCKCLILQIIYCISDISPEFIVH